LALGKKKLNFASPSSLHEQHYCSLEQKGTYCCNILQSAQSVQHSKSFDSVEKLYKLDILGNKPIWFENYLLNCK
jgi:hypothetical protein